MKIEFPCNDTLEELSGLIAFLEDKNPSAESLNRFRELCKDPDYISLVTRATQAIQAKK